MYNSFRVLPHCPAVPQRRVSSLSSVHLLFTALICLTGHLETLRQHLSSHQTFVYCMPHTHICYITPRCWLERYVWRVYHALLSFFLGAIIGWVLWCRSRQDAGGPCTCFRQWGLPRRRCNKGQGCVSTSSSGVPCNDMFLDLINIVIWHLNMSWVICKWLAKGLLVVHPIEKS